MLTLQQSSTRLRLLRLSTGLPQKVLARSVGLTLSRMCDLERHRYVPTIEVAQRVALFFGLPVHVLFPEVNND